ncbi:HAMP domain-containing histidine kinase [bacterium]|nr:HAMP domain-containing histidine kinase [bacterium]
MKFPITLKIFIGFLVIVLLSLAANLLFFLQLNRLEGFIHDSNLGAQKISILQNMLMDLQQEEKIIQSYYVLSSTETDSAAYVKKQYEQLSKVFKSHISKVSSKKLSKSLKNNIYELDLSFSKFQEWFGTEFALLDSGKFEEAWDLFQSEKRKREYRQFEELLSKLPGKSRNFASLTELEGLLTRFHSLVHSWITAEYKKGRFFQVSNGLDNSLALLKKIPGTNSAAINEIERSHSTLLDGFTRGYDIRSLSDSLFPVITDRIFTLRDSEFKAFQNYAKKSEELGTITRQIWLWGTLGMFLLSLLIAVVITTRIAKPIFNLKKATQVAKKGKYDELIPITSNDEIGELTMDFNEMLRELGALEEMKANFIASITHDLKSPLGRIKGALANLQDQLLGPVNDQQKDLLTMMEKDSKTLGRLIHNLLDLQKIEAGTFQLDYQKVEMNAFISDCIKDFTLEAKNNGIDIKKSLSFKELDVMIDQRQIVRVFDNLINNAIKFTEPGGKITVEGEVLKGKVKIGIIDTGRGIPPDQIKQVFDKFYQVKTKTFSSKGSGIGLTITKAIIKAHKGDIWVESDLGFGTAFYFELPIEIK